jgi:hypothetical protein
MEGATAEAALAGFTCILNRVHMPMRKTLTYDQRAGQDGCCTGAMHTGSAACGRPRMTAGIHM